MAKAILFNKDSDTCIHPDPTPIGSKITVRLDKENVCKPELYEVPIVFCTLCGETLGDFGGEFANRGGARYCRIGEAA